MACLRKIDLRICGQNIYMLKIVSSALFCGAKDGLSRKRPPPAWQSSGLPKAWRTSASLLSFIVVTGLALFGAGDARAQTASVTAVNDLSCIGDRIGRTGICTAKEFTTVLTFSQPAANTLTSCLAGTDVFVDVIADVSGTNTNRYDIAYFIGQVGNVPDALGGKCSVATFPSSPAPFADLDPAFVGTQDTCGDYVGGGVATLQMTGVKIRCQPAAGSGGLNVPDTIAWNAQQPYACNAANIIPIPDSKCLSGPVSATLVSATVQGWVQIIKKTTPSGDPQSFQFSASAPNGGTTSVSSFTLSDTQSQVVSIPLAATTRTISITESLAAGWEPGAVITCVRPDGSAAPFVTVDNATRTITANLLGLNNTAVCTFTNTKKKATVTLSKSWVNAALSDAVSVSATGLTSLASVANTATKTDTGPAQTLYVGSVLTLAEAFNPTASAANYNTTLACTGTAGLSSSTSTSTGTLTVGVADTAIVCTYTNTNIAAKLTISKTDSKDIATSGGTNSYVLTVANAGPGAADGSSVKDTVGTGLTCPVAGGLVTCTSSSGAVCPTAPLTFSQLTTGLAIATFPPNSSLQFAYTCNVN